MDFIEISDDLEINQIKNIELTNPFQSEGFRLGEIIRRKNGNILISYNFIWFNGSLGESYMYLKRI